jgi:hypothetical protein
VHVVSSINQPVLLFVFAVVRAGRRSLLLRLYQEEPNSTSSSSSSSSSSIQSGSMQRCLVLSSVAPLQQQPAAAAVSTEPSSCQQQGSWIEVPPGLYSISSNDLHAYLTTSCSSSSSTSHSRTCDDTPDVSTQCTVEQQQQQQQSEAQAYGANDSQATAAAAGAAGDGESGAPATCGVATPADLCAALPGLQHHPWTDNLLLQLQQYERAAHLVPSSSAAAAAQQVDDGVQNEQQHGRQQQQQQPASQEEASQTVLQLLQAAVNTRCWTINTLQARHSLQAQQQQQQQEVPSLEQQLQQMQLHRPQQQLQQGAEQQQQAAAHAALPPDLQDLLPPSPVLILFSGGVDSTFIAALAHLALPPEVPIDLSNVCFVGGASPDRLAAHSALLELAACAPQRQWRLIEVDSSLEEVRCTSVYSGIAVAHTVMDPNIGSAQKCHSVTAHTAPHLLCL